jgi:hypothetical protein
LPQGPPRLVRIFHPDGVEASRTGGQNVPFAVVNEDTTGEISQGIGSPEVIIYFRVGFFHFDFPRHHDVFEEFQKVEVFAGPGEKFCAPVG